MQPIRLGCVGLGEVFRIAHLPVLNCDERVEVTAVADIRAEAVQQASKELDCAGTDDWRALLQDAEIDALLICTPHHLHAEPAIAALREGKHVLVEKPMAPTVEECELMIAAAGQGQAVLMVAENYYYEPALQKAAALIEQQTIGQVTGLRLLQANPASYPPPGHWRWSAHCGGGVMLDPGVHFCALARWWGGQPRRIWADLHYPADVTREVEDSAEAIVDFGTGLCAHIAVNWRCGAVVWRYEIQGTDGVVLYEHYRDAQPARLRLVNTSGVQEFPVPAVHSSPESYRQEWDDFLTRITTGGGVGYPGEEALLDVAVVAAAYDSAQNGTWAAVQA